MATLIILAAKSDMNAPKSICEWFMRSGLSTVFHLSGTDGVLYGCLSAAAETSAQHACRADITAAETQVDIGEQVAFGDPGGLM